MNKNIIKGFVTGGAVLAAAAIMAGCTSVPKTEDDGLVSDSYSNTRELSAKFTVKHPTSIDTRMEKNIQNRLLNGFENWNRGYDAWKAWGDILYTKDSIYNVHGVRLTLEEYQNAMNMTFRYNTIYMGDFRNMLICGDWCAINYDIKTVNNATGKTSDGGVIEFVKFADYGKNLGTRVVEGWGGTTGNDYNAMMSFESPEEQDMQNAHIQAILDTKIPDTDNLAVKYPVKNPTSSTSLYKDMIENAVLNDFDSWNSGFDSWASWAEGYYSKDAVIHTGGSDVTLSGYLSSLRDSETKTSVQKVYFDNILIKDDWAALHYRTIKTDKATGKRVAGEAMEFIHFDVSGRTPVITEIWIS